MRCLLSQIVTAGVLTNGLVFGNGTDLANGKIGYFHNLVVQYRRIKSRVLMSPSALSEVFSSLAPLRATCSESVPCVDLSILYNGRLEKQFAITYGVTT